MYVICDPHAISSTILTPDSWPNFDLISSKTSTEETREREIEGNCGTDNKIISFCFSCTRKYNLSTGISLLATKLWWPVCLISGMVVWALFSLISDNQIKG